MTKKHKKGAGSGSESQGAGTHRGPETGNGRTASTGRGKPTHVANRDPKAPSGVAGILGFLWTRGEKK